MGTLHVWGECYPIEDPDKSCQERTEKGVTRKGRLLSAHEHSLGFCLWASRRNPRPALLSHGEAMEQGA